MPVAEDLQLLIEAAEAAGDLAISYASKTARKWDKPDGAGPVTEADLAVNDLLERKLRSARPDYGWLSEESVDSKARLDAQRCFVVDPIDGTRSFIEGSRTWAHALAIVENGRPIAGVVFLPARELLFSAGQRTGAFLNGHSIQATARGSADGAQILAARPIERPEHWRDQRMPGFIRGYRPSLAYRMAVVAQGRFDAMLTLRATWEWDIAAGDVIAREAGAATSDRHGRPLTFNNPAPQVDGLVAGAKRVHANLIEALEPKEPAS